MDGYPIPKTPTLQLHPDEKRESVDATAITKAWVESLKKCLAEGTVSENLPKLFIEDCWWRDFVSLTWDTRSRNGQAAVGDLLANVVDGFHDIEPLNSGSLTPLLIEFAGMVWVQTIFTFKTAHGEGRGLLKMANVGPGDWRAWTVFTQLEKLNIQADNQLVNGADKDEYDVLIVGAGQGGIMLAARLIDMGLDVVVVDSNARVGDSWRNRYDTVTLHTPKYTDIYPFLEYPSNWPKYLGREHIADFMESYAQLLRIKTRLNTTVIKADFDSASRKYRVTTKSRADEDGVLSAKHVVMAMGPMSERDPIIPDFAKPSTTAPPDDAFDGTLYHTHSHRSAREVCPRGGPPRKVAVIGTGASGHDVAQDFATQEGVETQVTLVQREPVFTFSLAAFEMHMLALWGLLGLAVADADFIGNSTPLGLIRGWSPAITRAMYAQDKATVDGLRARGMAVRTCDDEVEGAEGTAEEKNSKWGLADAQLIRGGGFYIDQGASALVLSGRIGVVRCAGGVEKLEKGGLRLRDGTKVEADVVVLATGYQGSVKSVERIMGADVVKKATKDGKRTFGSLDDENERIGWWRPTGTPGFWYMTGSFLMCRQYSQVLALQIAAVVNGWNEAHYAQ